MKIAICMPMKTNREPKTDDCLRALEAYSNGLQVGDEKIQTKFLTKVGLPLVKARTVLTCEALSDLNVTHLLWIDGDMVFERDSLERLLLRKLSIVGGLCFNRNAPYNPVLLKQHAMNFNTFGIVYDYPRNSLFEVDATGAAFLLVERKVFEHITYGKWWLPVNEEGEDISFCHRATGRIEAMQEGEKVKVLVDTGVKIGHIGEVIVDEEFALHYRGGHSRERSNVWNNPNTKMVLKSLPVPQGLKASVLWPGTDVLHFAQGYPSEMINIKVIGEDYATAFNESAKVARGDWLFPVLPKDVCHSDKVATLLEAASCSGAQAVFSSLDQHVDEIRASWTRPTIPNWSTITEQARALARPCVQTSSLGFHRSVYEKVGPFDSRFPTLFMWAWMRKATRLGIFFHRVHDTLGVERKKLGEQIDINEASDVIRAELEEIGATP